MKYILMIFFLLGNFMQSLAYGKDSLEDYQTIYLSSHEKKVFSQSGEDGILEKIFELLNIDTGYYVEFGVEDGNECNTRFLREVYGWQGLMMDGGNFRPEINLQCEFITAENINDLFQKYQVPDEFELLSIDVDFNDFYIWNALDSRYHPKVVVIEYNASHSPLEDKVVQYNPLAVWDKTNYFGASILALYNLGRKKGYSLVYAEKRGVNLFFIRNDLIDSIPYVFKNINRVSRIYRTPKYGMGPRGGHVEDPLFRQYVSSETILNAGF